MILQLFVQNIYLSVGIARFEIIKAKELNDEPHTGIHGDMHGDHTLIYGES